MNRQMEFTGEGWERPKDTIRRVTVWQSHGGPIMLEVVDDTGTHRHQFTSPSQCIDAAEKLRLVGLDAMRTTARRPAP